MIQIPSAVQQITDQVVNELYNAIPKLIIGLLFLVAAYIGIKIFLTVLKSILHTTYPEDQKLVVNMFMWIATALLWFGAALVLLNIVGLGELATSLGTATGFLALGVSYALSDRIADTVAGIYLLKDPDFNTGNNVTTMDITGTVKTIELRKTRLDVDGDTVVLPNSKVEEKWRKKNEG